MCCSLKILIIIDSAFVSLIYKTYYIGYVKLYAEIQNSITNYAVFEAYYKNKERERGRDLLRMINVFAEESKHFCVDN